MLETEFQSCQFCLSYCVWINKCILKHFSRIVFGFFHGENRWKKLLNNNSMSDDNSVFLQFYSKLTCSCMWSKKEEDFQHHPRSINLLLWPFKNKALLVPLWILLLFSILLGPKTNRYFPPFFVDQLQVLSCRLRTEDGVLVLHQICICHQALVATLADSRENWADLRIIYLFLG